MSRWHRNRRRADARLAAPRRKVAAGFTLIEVVVALAIAGLVLIAVDRLFSTGLRLDATAQRSATALMIAQSTLEALDSRALVASYNEDKELPGGYRRAVEVRPRPDLLPGKGSHPVVYLYQLSVAVSWQAGDRRRSLSLSEIRLGLPP